MMKNDFWHWLYPNSSPIYWFNLHESLIAFYYGIAMGDSLSIEDGHLFDDTLGEIDPDAVSFLTKDELSSMITEGRNRDYNFITDGTVDANIIECLYRFQSRYRRWYVCSMSQSAYEDDPTIIDKTFENAYEDLMNRLEILYEEYVPVLKAYENQKENLLAQIKTASTANSRFNDTPQNGGEWDDDNHTTNLTKMTSESATDGDTPIRRLEEVRRLWESVMTSMVDYLGDMLIAEENI